MSGSSVRVDRLMQELEDDIRGERRRRMIAHGGAPEYRDPELFADVEATFRRVLDHRDLEALLLPDLLDDPDDYTLQLRLRYASHRPLVGRLLMFVKRKVLLPISRWLYEYSLENFRKQQRVNRLLFACIEDSPSRTRSSRRLPASSPAIPRMKLACVIHRFGTDFAGELKGIVAASPPPRLQPRCHDRHDLRERSRHLGERISGGTIPRIGPLAVERFPVVRTQSMHRFSEISEAVFNGGASDAEEEEWFRENGPETPELLEFLKRRGADFDRVLFWSFRYYQTYFGLPLVADRSVLVPTAEEDPVIRMRAVARWFPKAAAFLFLTPEEQTLVAQHCARPLAPFAIIGSGLIRRRPVRTRPPSSIVCESERRSCCISAESIRTKDARRCCVTSRGTSPRAAGPCTWSWRVRRTCRFPSTRW